MRILGIDPGPTSSGWAVYDTDNLLYIESGELPNAQMLKRLTADTDNPDEIAIEVIGFMGMAVGAEVFETCEWVGRFSERATITPIRVKRYEVKKYLCASQKVKDPQVRAALIAKLGPVGTKRDPGPLFGVTGHAWSALAVAVTAKAKIDGTLDKLKAKK